MPENLDLGGGDPNAVDPQAFARWVQQAQAKLKAGGTLGPNELPTGFKVEGNQLVQDTNIGGLVRDMVLTAIAAFGGAAAFNAFTGTVPSAGSIPAEFGSNAVDTVSSAAPSAGLGGIPPEFGQTAVDTVSSPAPSAVSGLPNWLKTAQDLGSSLGAASAGRAQGRNLDNVANIGFAQAQNDLYNSELKAPQQIASNSVRGDILSNAKDVSIAAPSDIPVPQISGGLRPSMFSDSTRQTGRNITANAAATPLPVPTPPVLQPMETAGTTDDLLNTAGYVSNAVKPAYDIWKMFNHA